MACIEIGVNIMQHKSGSQWGNEHIFVAERDTITTVEQYACNQLLEFCMIWAKHAACRR
jgi:hypothetical protein